MTYYNLGSIVNTHGIRGEVKVKAITDFADERFQKGSQLVIHYQNTYVPVTVTSHRVHKNMHLLTFSDYASINDVEKFKTSELLIANDARPKLAEDEYYYSDIIDATVVGTKNQTLGVIVDIMTTKANDVWTVRLTNGKERLIPVVANTVLTVDADEKIVTIDETIEGLLTDAD